jgi:hypothetical protein
MSAHELVCGRCGGTNHAASTRCWVCYSPLAAEAAPAGSDAPAPTLQVAAKKDVNSPLVTALKIVFVLSCIAVMIPVLLFITCVGIMVVNPPSFH